MKSIKFQDLIKDEASVYGVGAAMVAMAPPVQVIQAALQAIRAGTPAAIDNGTVPKTKPAAV